MHVKLSKLPTQYYLQVWWGWIFLSESVGEMIFPFLFDDVKYLRAFSEAAKILARKRDWPKLYDENKLKQNIVPVGAVVYEHVRFSFGIESISDWCRICMWIRLCHLRLLI